MLSSSKKILEKYLKTKYYCIVNTFLKKYLEYSDKKEDDLELLREQYSEKEDPERVINAGRNNSDEDPVSNYMQGCFLNIMDNYLRNSGRIKDNIPDSSVPGFS